MSAEAIFFADLVYAIDHHTVSKILPDRVTDFYQMRDQLLMECSKYALEKIISHPRIGEIWKCTRPLSKNKNITTEQAITLFFAVRKGITHRKKFYQQKYQEEINDLGELFLKERNFHKLSPLLKFPELYKIFIEHPALPKNVALSIIKDTGKKFFVEKKISFDVMKEFLLSASLKYPEEVADLAMGNLKLAEEIIYNLDSKGIEKLWGRYKQNISACIPWAKKTPPHVLKESWKITKALDVLDEYLTHPSCTDPLFIQIWNDTKDEDEFDDRDIIKIQRERQNESIAESVAKEILQRNADNVEFLQQNYHYLTRVLNKNIVNACLSAAKLAK